MLSDGTIELKYINTNDQVADILTKLLPVTTHKKFKNVQDFFYAFNHSFTFHLRFRYQMGSFSFGTIFQKANQRTISSKCV